MQKYQKAEFEIIYMDVDDIVATSEDTAGDIDWEDELSVQDVI